MAYFPIFTDLSGKTVLIYGSNRHAREKVARLQPFGARCVVIAPEIDPEMAALSPAALHCRAFSSSDLLLDPALVIVAEEDKALCRRISALCQEYRIPVNVVDVPELCTFYFPSLVVQGSFSAGICTAGKSPTAAVLARETLEQWLPSRAAEILDWSYELRPMLRERYPVFSDRRAATRRIVEEAFRRNRPLTKSELHDCLAVDAPAP